VTILDHTTTAGQDRPTLRTLAAAHAAAEARDRAEFAARRAALVEEITDVETDTRDSIEQDMRTAACDDSVEGLRELSRLQAEREALETPEETAELAALAARINADLDARAEQARQTAGGDTEQGDTAYVEQVDLVLAEGGQRAATEKANAAHYPWCDRSGCDARHDPVSGTTIHFHQGRELTILSADDPTNTVTANLICNPLAYGMRGRTGDDGLPKVFVQAGGAPLTPQGARALAANLRYLASLAEADPCRAALNASADRRGGAR